MQNPHNQRMGIEHKHVYRFVYLKSDEWSNVRLEALAREDARCRVCGHRSLSNDAHHIRYKSSAWDTTSDDLVILCRACHNMIHGICKTIDETEAGLDEFRRVLNVLQTWTRAIHSGEIVVARPKIVPNGTRLNDAFCWVCNASNATGVEKRNVLTPPKAGSDWNVCTECWLDLKTSYPNGVSDYPEIRRWKKSRKIQISFDSLPVVVLPVHQLVDGIAP